MLLYNQGKGIKEKIPILFRTGIIPKVLLDLKKNNKISTPIQILQFFSKKVKSDFKKSQKISTLKTSRLGGWLNASIIKTQPRYAER